MSNRWLAFEDLVVCQIDDVHGLTLTGTLDQQPWILCSRLLIHCSTLHALLGSAQEPLNVATVHHDFRAATVGPLWLLL